MNQNKSHRYLFSPFALERLNDFIDRPVLMAFDLDGTLAPIVSDPDRIGIPADVREAFAVLIEKASVAVITGRSRRDALLHLGIMPHYLIGNHGVEGLPGWESREKDFVRTAEIWQNQLEGLVLPEDAGIEIENKGATISIHYRRAPNIQTAHASILCAIRQLHPKPMRISGKYIENLLPEGAPDKGEALCLLMQQEGFEKVFFAGDDETDEHVFSLDHQNIFTVRVGKSAGSQASFYLRGQYEVARLLGNINAILTQKEDKP